MWAILAHEVKYYIKNKNELLYLYGYFLSIILMIPFSQEADSSKIQSLASISLWVTLASASAWGASSLFRRDIESGRIEYYQFLPIGLPGIVFAKWLGFYLFLLVPLLAALPVAGVLFSLAPGQWGHYALSLALGSAALSIQAALLAAITGGMPRAGALLSLMILPLSIPVLIFGSAYCQLTGDLWQPHLGVLVGMGLLLLPVMCFAGAYSIRASN